MRLAFFLIVAALLAARTVPVMAADDDQKARFMAVCLTEATESKRRACECMHESSAATLSKLEFELLIATLGKDTQRQAQIKSDPRFDSKAYGEKALPGMKMTLACVMSRG